MNYRINFREVIYALSQSLDYVGIDDIFHGKRVAYMAAECAKTANWNQEDIDNIIFLGMIHDCGVSNTDVHTRLVTELDWEGSQVHCERGFNLLNSVNLFEKYANPILHHHTHWEDLIKIDNLTQKEKNFANLIYLTDRVDALRAQHLMKGKIEHSDDIKEVIKKYSNTYFSEELVNIFLETSNKSSFWYYLEQNALENYLDDWIREGETAFMDFEKVKEIAWMFSKIVDAKSSFTASHSINVSKIASFIANKIALSEFSKDNIELAALLHDLGKLRVDDYILEKPGKLTDDEVLVMNRHGFDSDIILRKIHGFKEIAQIASMHHETLDGKGYPFKLKGDEIPIEARVVAVADIFQALIQKRPYRESLDAKSAFSIIQKMTDEQKLDKDIVNILKDNLDEIYLIGK